MPKVTKRQARSCAYCEQGLTGKLRARRRLDEQTGEKKFAGWFYSCPCGALTLGQGGYNQAPGVGFLWR